jgi:hypothetical protein
MAAEPALYSSVGELFILRLGFEPFEDFPDWNRYNASYETGYIAGNLRREQIAPQHPGKKTDKHHQHDGNCYSGPNRHILSLFDENDQRLI